MDFNQFHFENTNYLWGLLILPVVTALYWYLYRNNTSIKQLESFIDKNLLPHLLINNFITKKPFIKNLFIWNFIWLLLMFALAGPRWDFKQVETFTPDKSLVILLDLSKSMDATDVKPSRLSRAKQEIEDILNLQKGVKIGLVAFAGSAHMITPLTDDVETIRHMLPSMETGLVYMQGSKLSPALNMASRLLNSEPGSNKSILIVTDGGFEDSSAISLASKLAKQGININTLGIGTKQGAPIYDANGNFIKQGNKMVISSLEDEKLKEISKVSGGEYLLANYSENDSQIILNKLDKKAKAEEAKHKKTRHWEERFYLLVFPIMLLLLPWFRKGFVFVTIIFFTVYAGNADATEFKDYFKNKQTLAKEAIQKGEYSKATGKFDDNYKNGVAEYKAGNFAKAEELFRKSKRKEVAGKASYNLAGSLVKQQKLEDAIKEYENLLKVEPNNKKAQHNLEVVKKMLEQKKKQQQQDKKNKKDKQNKKQDKNKSKKSDKQDKNKQGKSGSGKQKSDKQKGEPKQQDKQKNAKGKNKKSEQDKQAEKGKQKQSAKKMNDKQQADKDIKDKQKNEKQQVQEGKKGNENKQPKDSMSAKSIKSAKKVKTQKDIDADQWLNRIKNDPKSFLKNQFYIESKRNNTQGVSKPW